jgi:hypothetical protein
LRFLIPGVVRHRCLTTTHSLNDVQVPGQPVGDCIHH